MRFQVKVLLRRWLVRTQATSVIVFAVVFTWTSICIAEQKKLPEDLVGEWIVKKMNCEGDMWWHPEEFSMKKQGEDVYVFYEAYRKMEENGSWSLYENLRPDDPMGMIYTVKDEFYYFEITLLQSYGITNKVRFYLNLQKKGTRLSGTYLRTVSFPLDQIEMAEKILGSNRILEGTQKWELDSQGTARQLVDIVVGSCEIRFVRLD